MFHQLFHLARRVLFMIGTCLLAGALNYISHHATLYSSQLKTIEYA